MRAQRPQRLAVIVRRFNGGDIRFGAGPGPVANRANNIMFKTRLMEGFAEGQFDIARSSLVGIEFSIYDTVQFVTETGGVAYEGRIAGLQLADNNRVTVLTGSWMSHARDMPLMPYIYIDRDVTKWGDPIPERVTWLKSNNRTLEGPEQSADSGAMFRLISKGLPFNFGSLPDYAAYYEAPPGAFIGWTQLTMQRTSADFNTADPNWSVTIGNSPLSDPGGVSLGDSTANLASLMGAATTTRLTATTKDRHFTCVELYYGAGNAGGPDNVERGIYVTNPLVAGPHGLTFDSNNYLRVSDIIKHSAGLACPLFDLSQLADSSVYRVGQCRLDDPTDPYDLWLSLNKYELKNLAVWRNRQLVYEDIDRNKVSWQITGRATNTTVKFDGPQAGQQLNGMVVRFQNVLTNRADIVTPTSNTNLADTDSRIPANVAGIQAWGTLQMPDPDTPTGAARYGQLTLQAFNRQKRPGKASVVGTLKDGSNQTSDAMWVRASDTVLVTDEVTPGGPQPRLIVETTYYDETQKLEMSIDATSQDADALLADLLDAGKVSI